MKKKVTFAAIGAVAFLAAGIAVAASRWSREVSAENPEMPTAIPTEVPAVMPTEIPNAPTEVMQRTAEPTDRIQPTETLTPAPTKEPTPESTKAPTKAPTPEATATPTVTLAPTVTPIPTPTPLPTAAPTTAAVPTPTPLVEYKKDGVDVRIVQTYKVNDTVYIYVYENSRIALVEGENGTIVRIVTNYENPEEIDVTTAVYELEEYLEKENIIVYEKCKPTPTPTPSPYPTPNPEQPKMLASFSCGKEGDDVTEEIWDNGYVYVRGNGTLRRIDFSEQKKSDKAVGRALTYVGTSWFVLTHAVIDEGITSLEDAFYFSIKSLVYIELPSTLKTMNIERFNAIRNTDSIVTVVGYKNGERITFTVPANVGLGDAILKNLDITR